MKINLIRQINNENGSAIVIAIALSLLGTVLAVSTIHNSSLEIRLSDNLRNHEVALAGAEAAAYAGAQVLHDRPNAILRTRSDTYVSMYDQTGNQDPDGSSPYAWDGSEDRVAPGLTNTRQGAWDAGPSKKDSLNVIGPKVRQYHLFGRYQDSKATAIVGIGYRKKV